MISTNNLTRLTAATMLDTVTRADERAGRVGRYNPIGYGALHTKLAASFVLPAPLYTAS